MGTTECIPSGTESTTSNADLSKASESSTASPQSPPEREISFEHSRNLADLLSKLNLSLLISTYQAGKLAVLGVADRQLTISFHNFERVMGLAARTGQLAVGAQRLVWFLNDAREIAPKLEPLGKHDACFLTRAAHFTGDIHIHELAFAGEQLWCANTMFNCLCTIESNYSFVPRWRPTFISALVAEDRCHLNGFTLARDGTPAYATVIAETDTAQDWRQHKVDGGCLIHVPSNQIILRGLSMPHSPRLYQGNLLVLDSGRGRLLWVERTGNGNATSKPLADFPGYTRGLAIHAGHAFVGLSRIRETNIFGGLPIAEKRDELKCGVGVVELSTGRLVGHIEFKSGVEEIFAVEVLPGIRCPALSGPYPHLDNAGPIWNAPMPLQE